MPLLKTELDQWKKLKFFGLWCGDEGIMKLVLETNYCGYSVENELEELGQIQEDFTKEIITRSQDLQLSGGDGEMHECIQEVKMTELGDRLYMD